MAAEAPVQNKPQYGGQTLREIVHASVGGTQVRIRVSNLYGASAIQIADAHIAIRATGSDVDPANERTLTFSGQNGTSLGAGAQLQSDAVTLAVSGGTDLAVSLSLAGNAEIGTMHSFANVTSYVANGDVAGVVSLSSPQNVGWWPLLNGVDVFAGQQASAIVAIGDSITDGVNSTPELNHRWTDRLSDRLRARTGAPTVAVLNAGIAGNRLLHDGTGANSPGLGTATISRFSTDVLQQPGVKAVILFEGINDIGLPGNGAPQSEAVTVAQLTQAIQTLIAQAHANGLKIYGATLAPFEGASYFNAQKETDRQALNQWIRTSNAYDGVVDFDQILRDPSHQTQLLPEYDGGDHLHPNDAGYQAMSDAINSAWF